jgi:catechol 2,3-dioxygenase-like lactoylglutathione lyase family enzyme
MELNHVALACRDETACDAFYADLLGLRKLSAKTLPPELAGQIFDIQEAFRIVTYGSEALVCEIFISDRFANTANRIEHLCLEVADRDAFLQQCRAKGVSVRLVPRGDHRLLFIRDDDGHIFEIKETPAA